MILATIGGWLKRLHTDQLDADYQRGYDHAAGRLLQTKGGDVLHLANAVDTARCFGDYIDFDRGVEAALDDWATSQQYAGN